MTRTPILLTLSLATATLLAPSCVAVAGAGLGYVISREVLPNAVHEAHVADDVDHVWTMARESLEVLHDPGSPIATTDTPRKAETKVNGSKVTLDVEAYDYQHTIVRVFADGALAADTATAKAVLEDLLTRLELDSGHAIPASATRN